MSYTSKFLGLECAGNVLNVVNPMKKAEKEISESMGMIAHLRDIALKHKMEYTLLDMCAGNALTSVISVHLLPIKKAIAIDKSYRSRRWDMVNRFEYFTMDFNNFRIDPNEKYIITATHSCKNLTKEIIDMYLKNDNIHYLVLMPCCVGEFEGVPEFIKKKIGKYISWSYYLTIKARGKLHEDKNILSPCNNIIVANK